jgi:hypothetical protein
MDMRSTTIGKDRAGNVGRGRYRCRCRRGSRPAILFAIAVCVVAAAGCSTTTVSVADPDPVTEYRERNTTAHTFFWGLAQDPQTVIAGNCESNSLDSVRVSTNYGFALVTVLSLGIWTPIEVNWRCAEAADGGSGDF